ncbi:MAG: TetR/AcrR family transcriptional regulator [Cyclobacteriaceae bacterium]|nr:TetR/AcrR family transcriptional regulator [Cyclobacteriaceae bacterium]MCH8514913.1 TetR/AcrR family transcriptional regulator [Cyclobacteriaceae bacterium]
MGRKSIEKSRIEDDSKKQEWAEQLIALFFEKGIKAYNMDQVADYLQTSKATLYKYYRSKDEIVESILDIILDELEMYKFYIENEDREYTKRLLDTAVFFGEKLENLSPEFLEDLQILFPSQWDRITSFVNEITEKLHQYYIRGIELEIFKHVNIHVLLATDRLMIHELVNPAFLRGSELSLSDAIREFYKYKFEGIVN